MDNILPSNETTEFENRLYLNPNLVVDETSNFIDKYRNIQNNNNQQMTQQTANLGTNVSTNLGGLTGSQNYWTSRYQMPNTASTAANLRATMQATALKEVLANEKAKWQKRYQDAYNAQQKRAWNNSKGGSGNSGGTNGGNTGNPASDGEVEEKYVPSGEIFRDDSVVYGVDGYYTVIGPDGIAHAVDMDTGKEYKFWPDDVAEYGSNGNGFSGGGGGGGSVGGW